MDLQELGVNGHCCSCGKALDKRYTVHMLLPVPWVNPTWYGYYAGENGRLGVAFLCQSCGGNDKYLDRTIIKEIVEFNEGHFIYHPIKWLNHYTCALIEDL